MRAAKIVAIPALLLALAGFNARPTDSLSWLSGHWVARDRGGWTEESWSSPAGGMLLGTGKSVEGEFTRDWEFMRIDSDGEGRIVFWGSPRGAPPVGFPLVSRSATAVAFENPKHDYPTRIEYRLAGGVLTATISGPNDTRPMSWHYRRR
jgi:Domain of unknown function (DUF6265)